MEKDSGNTAALGFRTNHTADQKQDRDVDILTLL